MSTNEKINPGDIVALKSGGPRMTVEKIISEEGENKRYLCKWFKLNDQKEGRYFEYMLKKLDDE
ncbi:MAG: DUF2158 domain-containing protein [Balneolaceae bacterium]